VKGGVMVKKPIRQGHSSENGQGLQGQKKYIQ
jgi:hypothetical protein